MAQKNIQGIRFLAGLPTKKQYRPIGSRRQDKHIKTTNDRNIQKLQENAKSSAVQAAKWAKSRLLRVVDAAGMIFDAISFSGAKMGLTVFRATFSDQNNNDFGVN